MSKLCASIILPVHDNSPFLQDCLNSINSQINNELYELIIVLDRVSSSSLKLINQFQFNLKYKIISNTEKGLANSLNLGILESETEYIARIDHDDIMKPDRLRSQLNFFYNNPEYVVVGSNVILIDSLGSFIRKSNYPTTDELIKSKLKKENVLAHPSVMIKKISIFKAGMYRNFYEGAEDYDLWLRLSKFGKMANLSECLTLYRQHPGQMSTINLKKQWIITESVKTSAALKIEGSIELDAKYRNVEDWYNQNLRIKFKYYYVRFSSLVNKVMLSKYWSKIVKLK
jgi:glycosyltransferase involved in cell wall biosynthesis